MNFAIAEMEMSDWAQVAAIYRAGIKTEIAVFQKDVPCWEEWDQSHCRACRLVARSGNTILGWAALSPTSNRCVYAGVAEVSVYVDEAHRGQGIGEVLVNHLIKRSEETGYWTLQGGIIKENTPSRELSKKCGFREIGIREKLGKMDNGKWHDVVLVERRSQSVGID